ncbi:glycosyltransferase family 2 protein [Fluviicola taffensis]|uniref:Glycosyl transferase family 2 n=1 Tax=Fluviicola taffensis (strain DSM 16823 / NCIMB 13979 / RW262) TaxID=755732 RepID=F2IHQ0_FLUTR|nr:glycosyltransferase [Fluviicola taffensis]AEA44828.1 glycosyl transferase family 2 [Fluviicola taffensis DSM 16823]
MALISILTPYRNAEKYIRETALSILAQTHTDWEWILVNDHSIENELEAIADLLNDPRIKLLENSGKGIVDALCTAFEHSSGEYITRMDADDVMPDFKLAEFAKFFENGKSQIVTGKVTYFSQTESISSGYLAYEKWLNERIDNQDFLAHIYRECSVASANWMMRKSDLENCGGFDGLRYPEDYDLLFRWYEAGYSIKGLDLVTHLWRDHDLRTSKTSENYQQKAFFSLKVNRFIELDWDPDLQLIVNGTGQKGRLTAKILLEKNVSFVWVSHEAEKFTRGVFGHPIVGLNGLSNCYQAQILNTTLLPELELKAFYGKVISKIYFYQL